MNTGITKQSLCHCCRIVTNSLNTIYRLSFEKSRILSSTTSQSNEISSRKSMTMIILIKPCHTIRRHWLNDFRRCSTYKKRRMKNSDIFLDFCAGQIFLADICFELVHYVHTFALSWVGLNYLAHGYPFIIPSKCKSNTSGSISWHHSTSRKRESDNNWDKDECKQRILLTMTMTMEILTIATSQMKTRLCLKWSTAIYKYKFNTNQSSLLF